MREKYNSPQLTLGQLISEIEKCGIVTDSGKDKFICYDFGSAIPTELDSWRGVYDHLALGYMLTGHDNTQAKYQHISAKEILAHLKNAIGKTYTGWKGGDYVMDINTPVWVSNSGNADHTGIVGILDEGWRLIILTAYCDIP